MKYGVQMFKPRCFFYLPHGWLGIWLLLFCSAIECIAADVGNCLMCHKYPGLSRVDENGAFRLLFINEGTFRMSVHTKVKCEDCHTDINKIPHENVKKVDCLTQCHIIEPSSEKKFSHKEVDRFLSQSVHSKLDNRQNPKKYIEDLPSCKDCHDNPLYRPKMSFRQIKCPSKNQAVCRYFTETCFLLRLPSKNGYLDFIALGFPPQWVAHLNSSEVVGLIDKYKTFYMPAEIDFGDGKGIQ